MEFEFCPRCGGRLELREVKAGEPERPVCSECGFVFYLGPKLAAGAIFELGGGIVMIRRAIEPGYGRWTFPGGYVDRREVVEEAVRREILEETGVEVEVVGLQGLYSYVDTAVALAVYTAEVRGGEPAPLDEVLEVRSFAPEEIPWDKLAFPSTRDALRDYVRRGS
ncbi:NUDIX domain-containing protein [Rubrobacter taiwanensis]|jgi:8-oxo-dGTP diphosphatase|uniref:NUDIX domain-containing protein n=1 Tax=Rubrobacter taiwanensis TaxID=185139 RepID=A0A4R1B9U8_9ACTN|nr:NUDIX hydrolase [Rubrobacter taiwanensis]TCJ13705.1 NUDIX domain-containing protein [Rubrobacter taiwanensis]